MALKLVTAPTVEPVTLDQAKSHLRVDHTYDDLLITAYIQGARLFAEKFMGRALVTQTWDLFLDRFPGSCSPHTYTTHPAGLIEVPLPPLQSVTSISYTDSGGNTQTLDPAQYEVDSASEPGRIFSVQPTWPIGPLVGINDVTVRFTAGYPASSVDSPPDSPPDLTANVPPSIKNAILLHVGTLYAQRESVVIATIVNQVPTGGILHLLRQYRVVLGMA